METQKNSQTSRKKRGIKKRVYPHLLRHSLATNLLKRGCGLIGIKEQLGHAHLRTTEEYIHSLKAVARQEYDKALPEYF